MKPLFNSFIKILTMYNPKDICFVGKHDYDKSSDLATGWNKTFSIGIFRWELKANGRELKKGKTVVRVSGLVVEKERVFEVAEGIVNKLDAGDWDGRKTVSVK